MIRIFFGVLVSYENTGEEVLGLMGQVVEERRQDKAGHAALLAQTELD